MFNNEVPIYVADQMAKLTPNGCYSLEQLNRQLHEDLAYLDDRSLLVELWTIRSILFWAPPGHWLHQREQAIINELAARRRQSPPSHAQLAQKSQPIRGVRIVS